MAVIETTTPTIEHGDVVVWFEEVGPERAKALLKTYKVDYRKYRPTYAEGLARDMINGVWVFDGATVRIDKDGNLFDGQHRLNAVIESGVFETFLFVAGIVPEAYNTADTNLPRTYGDTLRRRGYQNVLQRGALVKLIHRWETGRSLDDGRRLTSPEMDEVHDKYVDSVNRALKMSASTAKKVFMPASLVSFSWWILSRYEQEKAFTFMVSLAEGENLRRGNPAYALRERLRIDADENYTRNEYMHLVFSAWNAFVEGRELTRLVLPKGFVSREKIVNPYVPAEEA